MLDNVLTQDIDVSIIVRKAGYPEAVSIADVMINATNIRMDRRLQVDQPAETDFPTVH